MTATAASNTVVQLKFNAMSSHLDTHTEVTLKYVTFAFHGPYIWQEEYTRQLWNILLLLFFLFPHSSSQLFLILYLFRLSDLRVPFHHIPLQTQIPLHVSSYWFSFIFFSFHFFHPDLTSQQFLRWLPATLEEKHVVAQAQETDEGGLWCLFPLLVKMSGKNHAGWQVKCAEKWVTEHQLRVSIFYSESLMWKLGHPAVLVSVSLNVEKKKIYSSILGGKNLDKQMVPNWMDQFQITQDGI